MARLREKRSHVGRLGEASHMSMWALVQGIRGGRRGTSGQKLMWTEEDKDLLACLRWELEEQVRRACPASLGLLGSLHVCSPCPKGLGPPTIWA